MPSDVNSLTVIRSDLGKLDISNPGLLRDRSANWHSNSLDDMNQEFGGF